MSRTINIQLEKEKAFKTRRHNKFNYGGQLLRTLGCYQDNNGPLRVTGGYSSTTKVWKRQFWNSRKHSGTTNGTQENKEYWRQIRSAKEHQQQEGVSWSHHGRHGAIRTIRKFTSMCPKRPEFKQKTKISQDDHEALTAKRNPLKHSMLCWQKVGIHENKVMMEQQRPPTSTRFSQEPSSAISSTRRHSEYPMV